MAKNLDTYNSAHSLFVKEIVKKLGDNLLCVIAIGSWVTKTIQPGLSDLDFLLVTQKFVSEDFLRTAFVKRISEGRFGISIGIDLVTLNDLKRPQKIPGKAILSLASLVDGYAKISYGHLPHFTPLDSYLFSEDFFFFNFKLMCYLESKSALYLQSTNLTELRKAVVKKLKSCVTLLRLINLYENKEKEFDNELLLAKYCKLFEGCGIENIVDLSRNRLGLLKYSRNQLINAFLYCQNFINELSNLYLKGGKNVKDS